MEILGASLRGGGVLVLETPNTQSVDARLFRGGLWGGYHFPRHWNLMNPESLTRLASDQGLEVMSFDFLPSHSFWIYSFHHWFGHALNWPRAARFFNPYRNLALLALFTGFDLVRSRLGFKTSTVQLVATKNGAIRAG